MLLNLLYYDIPATVIDLAYPIRQKGQQCQNRLKKARAVDASRLWLLHGYVGSVGPATQASEVDLATACAGRRARKESGA